MPQFLHLKVLLICPNDNIPNTATLAALFAPLIFSILVELHVGHLGRLILDELSILFDLITPFVTLPQEHCKGVLDLQKSSEYVSTKYFLSNNNTLLHFSHLIRK